MPPPEVSEGARPCPPSSSECGLQNYARISSTPQAEVCEPGQGRPTKGHRDKQTGARAQHLLQEDYGGTCPAVTSNASVGQASRRPVFPDHGHLTATKIKIFH